MADINYVATGYTSSGYSQTGVTIDWGTKVIFIPTFFMVQIQTVPSAVYQLDLNDLWLALKDLEDSENGMMFPDTHIRNASVSVSGAVLAPVIEIINGYSVTFEELSVPYRVNAVGANSNIGEKQNVNTVSLSTSNSAGLQDLNSLQAASFGGVVSIDITSQYSTITYPSGTRSNPVNSMETALQIAAARGLTKLNIMKSMSLTSSDFSSGYTFVGDNPVNVIITIESAANVDNCTFINLTIQGTLDDSNILRECNVLDITHINGFMFQCSLNGTITLGGGAQAMIMDCFSGIAGGGINEYPKIDMGGSGQQLALRNFNGGIGILNSTGTDTSSLDMNSGRVIFENTCTGGVFTVRGISDVEDSSAGATINDKTATSGINNAEAASMNANVVLLSNYRPS